MMADHERHIPCPRRPLGSHWTPAAQGTTQAEGRPPSGPGSSCPRWHHLRLAHGLPVAVAPAVTYRVRIDFKLDGWIDRDVVDTIIADNVKAELTLP